MNERIRELSKQAGFYANPDIEKFEKFALLIVRECADIAGAAEPYKAEDLIKKHFGVEE
jgi:hypothetical protein